MREQQFRALYADTFDPLLAYALRRVDEAEDAADVVSETFLVAWRRRREIPSGEAARLWLYGVARRVLANHRRSTVRRDRLGLRLRSTLAAYSADHADRVAAGADLLHALSQLRPADREVLELALWEGLEPREIAVVLDVSAVTARARLSRARRRIQQLVGHDFQPAGHVPGEPTITAIEGGVA